MPVKRLFRTSSSTLSVAIDRLANEVTGVIHRDRPARRHEHRRVVLLDDDGAGEPDARLEARAVEHARGSGRAVEEDAPLARRARCRPLAYPSREIGLARDADRGRPQIEDLEIRVLVGVAVYLRVARVERL